MPANLPPQYYELEREFRAERDTREKLRMAEELLAMMPKHKGTDKLQADMKAKISKLKKDLEQKDHQHGAAAHVPAHDHIDKEGAGQVILIGPPNCGKSSLVDVLTKAKPLVADYPYSTREPLAGMMVFETIQFQLIDTPPISSELYEPYMTNLIRAADIVALVCDLSDPQGTDALMVVIEKLREKRILLGAAGDPPAEEHRHIVKKTMVLGHKAFEGDFEPILARLRTLFPSLTILATSILDDQSLDAFRRGVFEVMNIMRVYTKHIGEEPKLVDPVILRRGGTVADAALAIHKEFLAKLKFAKVWGPGKFDGQRVQHDFELTDGDVIEFHI
ncbi:MAG: 50S ribosome-binding GTPase [candidate division Zixibacteria bacterium]|nr:50S ribosome-binding GTPase [candidate division Zixibacteria bacterium]